MRKEYGNMSVTIDNERPYLKLLWDQLNDVYARNTDSPDILQYLVSELAFRKSSKALHLQQEVIAKLNKLTALSFAWPSTYATEGDKSLDPVWPEVGLLRAVGYTVGEHGVNQFRRYKILDAVFFKPLPNHNSPDYMNEWGVPKSAKRLQKIANSIASFVRSAKRNENNMNKAIFEWESDLNYLYQQHYLNQFNFQWPKES